ncbi:hypothetical protein [Auritidibacter ignavus]|uniref:hypothetical protein n=1 Tax=Auritidibacter ignavus TaxID=678932 RepID=UPI003CC5E396
MAQVARELEINPGALGNWVHKHRKANPAPQPSLSPTDYGRLAVIPRECSQPPGELHLGIRKTRQNSSLKDLSPLIRSNGTTSSTENEIIKVFRKRRRARAEPSWVLFRLELRGWNFAYQVPSIV